jgi:hypothetical protein
VPIGFGQVQYQNLAEVLYRAGFLKTRAVWTGEVQADEEGEEGVLIDEEDELVPLDGLLLLPKVSYALHLRGYSKCTW